MLTKTASVGWKLGLGTGTGGSGLGIRGFGARVSGLGLGGRQSGSESRARRSQTQSRNGDSCWNSASESLARSIVRTDRAARPESAPLNPDPSPDSESRIPSPESRVSYLPFSSRMMFSSAVMISSLSTRDFLKLRRRSNAFVSGLKLKTKNFGRPAFGL